MSLEILIGANSCISSGLPQKFLKCGPTLELQHDFGEAQGFFLNKLIDLGGQLIKRHQVI